MFSLDNFYHTLYVNFFNDTTVRDYIFYPFGSTKSADVLMVNYAKFYHSFKEYQRLTSPSVLFYDQEPLQESVVNDVKIFNGIGSKAESYADTVKRLKILANSEKSKLKTEICKYWLMEDWYYFFHGFAALDWYKDFKYFPKFENNFSKVFICLNRLCTKDRSYRLTLVSKLSEKNLLKDGVVSLCLDDIGAGTWRSELIDPNTLISRKSKKLVYNELKKVNGSLIADQVMPPGWSSADFNKETIRLHKSALWNVVTETVFYQDKLHLTEKIFKPIVTRRPFILVGAWGNLAYLKSYGFKTFDRWIDESYDNEADPDARLDMITSELEKLCKLDHSQLVKMHSEMEEILDYNFDHFFGNFKTIIVNEMVDNLEAIFARWNCNRIDDRGYDVSNINFKEIKKRLAR